MFTRVRGGCVIHRCQNKNSTLETGPGYLGDVTHRKRGLRFEKKQLVEFPPRKKKVDFQSWARPDDFVRYGRCALVGLRADDVKAVSSIHLWVILYKYIHNCVKTTRTHTHTHTQTDTYCHPQTDYFFVSQLFSVDRHAVRFMLGSKPPIFTLKVVAYCSAVSRSTSATEW